MRAWIEICANSVPSLCGLVALFMRAWIEILASASKSMSAGSRPLHEGVD